MKSMKLTIIAENEFMRRLKKAGPDLQAIQDEFGVDWHTALKYRSMWGGGRTYGEGDIDNLTLHRVRAPQCCYKLLKYFGVNDDVIRKIIRFNIDNWKAIRHHRISPVDKESLRLLDNNERLVSLVDRETIAELGQSEYRITTVPWECESERPAYVYKPENQDIVNTMVAMHKAGNKTGKDLLHGLVFCYPMTDVYNYVRSHNTDLVDKVCGNVDNL